VTERRLATKPETTLDFRAVTYFIQFLSSDVLYDDNNAFEFIRDAGRRTTRAPALLPMGAEWRLCYPDPPSR
jgi:hypothetical protein